MWGFVSGRLFGQSPRQNADSPSQGESTTVVTPAATSDHQETVCRAVRLARLGRYTEAEVLLRKQFGAGSWPETAVDLLAKMKAQQGKWAEALVLWQQLACKSSQPAPYIDAVRYIRRKLSRDCQPGIVGRRKWRLTGEELTGGDPRIITRVQARSVEIGFREKLFEDGDARLREEIKPVLTALGKRLEPLAGLVCVAVVGHAHEPARTSGEIDPDNGQLAMQRAMSVFEHLVSTTRLLPSSFLLRAAGEFELPFLGAFADVEAWNETVTLVIAPAATTPS